MVTVTVHSKDRKHRNSIFSLFVHWHFPRLFLFLFFLIQIKYHQCNNTGTLYLAACQVFKLMHPSGELQLSLLAGCLTRTQRADSTSRIPSQTLHRPPHQAPGDSWPGSSIPWIMTLMTAMCVKWFTEQLLRPTQPVPSYQRPPPWL